MSTNYHSKVPVEPKDRRFSMPDLTTDRLDDVMSSDDINTLSKLFEDDEFLSYFRQMLCKKFSKSPKVLNNGEYGKNRELKNTATFEKCFLQTAPDEIRFTIDNIIKKRSSEGVFAFRVLDFDKIQSLYLIHKKNMGIRTNTNRGLFINEATFFGTLMTYTIGLEKIVEFRNGEWINIYGERNQESTSEEVEDLF